MNNNGSRLSVIKFQPLSESSEQIPQINYRKSFEEYSEDTGFEIFHPKFTINNSCDTTETKIIKTFEQSQEGSSYGGASGDLRKENYLSEFSEASARQKVITNLGLKNIPDEYIKSSYFQGKLQLSLEDIINTMFIPNVPKTTKASVTNASNITIYPTGTSSVIGTSISSISIKVEASIDAGVQSNESYSNGILETNVQYYDSTGTLQTVTNQFSVSWNDRILNQTFNISQLPNLHYGFRNNTLKSISAELKNMYITFPQIEVSSTGGVIKSLNGNDLNVILKDAEPIKYTVSETILDLNTSKKTLNYSGINPGFVSHDDSSYSQFTLGRKQWSTSSYYYLLVPQGTTLSTPVVQTSFGDSTLGLYKYPDTVTRTFNNGTLEYDKYVLTNGTTDIPYRLEIEPGKYLIINFS